MSCKHCGGKSYDNLKVGVILIGGSLKGIYGHTGVLSAIDELSSHGIKPSVILGASAGSVMASFYASGMSNFSMYRHMLTLKPNDFIDLLPKAKLFYELVINKGRGLKGFVQGNKLEKYVNSRLKDKDDFNKTKIPLYISAVSLDTYEQTIFNTGKISDKVRASTSVPILFCPKRIDGVNYIDGAIMRDQLPKKLYELHPDLDVIIVSSFLHEPTAVEKEYLENSTMPMLEITRRVLSIQERFEWPKKIGKAKVIKITPQGLRAVDFFKPDPTIARDIFQQSRAIACTEIRKGLKLL